MPSPSRWRRFRCAPWAATKIMPPTCRRRTTATIRMFVQSSTAGSRRASLVISDISPR